MKILIALIIFSAIAYFWYINKQKDLLEKSGIKKANAKERAAQSEKSAFRCVTIKPGRTACKTAQILKNKPILMSEAISLPLSACDAAKCDCQFLRHDDRRMEERRNDIYVARQIIVDENNNRKTKDRRN
ncbi:MAG: hypothetical protein ACKE5M_00170 [Methylophilaceae bacterium]